MKTIIFKTVITFENGDVKVLRDKIVTTNLEATRRRIADETEGCKTISFHYEYEDFNN